MLPKSYNIRIVDAWFLFDNFVSISAFPGMIVGENSPGQQQQ